MNISTLNQEFQGMDMSLLDQLLKGRFNPGLSVLDAGFGAGRNLFWFLNNGFEVFGIDQNEEAVDQIRQKTAQHRKQPNRFVLGKLEALPWEGNRFEIIICNAVLHFATSHEHFNKMFGELIRVLKPEGILFIRMTSNIGIADQLDEGINGVFALPDGSRRYLITREMIATLVREHELKFVEELKTVNVNDVRCMSTLVLSK